MTAIQPLEQGISQPVGYGRPPVATRFRPGRSGNPAGRPTAGASLREWLNVLQDWTVGDLRALAAHPRTGAMKRAAAVTWIQACSRELTPAGLPVAGHALDFILKHTSGRPGRADHRAGDAGAVLQPPPADVLAAGAELLSLVDGGAEPFLRAPEKLPGTAPVATSNARVTRSPASGSDPAQVVGRTVSFAVRATAVTGRVSPAHTEQPSRTAHTLRANPAVAPAPTNNRRPSPAGATNGTR